MFLAAHGNTRLARALVRLAAYASALLLSLTFCSSLMAAQQPKSDGSFASFWITLALLLLGDSMVAWFAVSQGYLFEWRLERRWKKTCAGLGESFTSQRTRRMMNPLWSIGGTLTRTYQERSYPKLREVNGTAESWTGLIYIFYGQTVEDYNKQAAAFAHAFEVKYCSFERTDGAGLRIRCGAVQVPDQFEYQPEQLLTPSRLTLPQAALERPALREAPPLQTMHLRQLLVARETLRAIPMARDINGDPWYMPVEENHILIAGRSGSGKNSWTWSLVFGLAQAREAGLVRLWGLDPKKVELSFGREWWDEYADTVEGMVELLEKVVQDLLERNAQLQGRARKIEPSPDLPLNVIIIDELAYLSALVTDKKLRDRAQAAMGAILLLGRATGYVLVACTQDVRKEVINFRDYFITRVALAMPEPLVDLCLGDGMWEAGAKCDQIPLRNAGAGCAFVLDELSSEPKLVRSAWISDEAIRLSLDLPSAVRGELQWPD